MRLVRDSRGVAYTEFLIAFLPFFARTARVMLAYGQLEPPSDRGMHKVPVPSGAGAAIVATLCGGSGPLPPLTVTRVGSGAGERDFPDVPNILRGFLGELPEQADHRKIVGGQDFRWQWAGSFGGQACA